MDTLTCKKTGTIVEAKPGKTGPKLPRGWKWLPNGDPISPEGLRAGYRHVAIQCRIVGMIDGDTRATNERAKELWRELRLAVRHSQDDVAVSGNALLTALYAAEPEKLCRPGEDGKVKLPKMPKINGYQVIRATTPGLDTRSAVSLAQRINRVYSGDRWEMLRGLRSLRSLRPDRQPVPIHNQGVTLSYVSETDAVPILSVPIRGQRWKLVLSVAQTGSRRKGRVGLAKRRVSSLISGDGWIGEMMLVVRAQPGTNRDSNFKGTDLIAQIAAWVPRETTPIKHLDGDLAVRSAPDALLVSVDSEGERIWTLNADNLRRWQAQHKRHLARWADDRKREQRPPPTFEARLEAACAKHRRRCRTAMHDYAAQTVAYAARRRCARIVLDLTDRSYADGSLPWFDFLEKMKQKAEQVGIVIEQRSPEPEAASGDVTSE